MLAGAAAVAPPTAAAAAAAWSVTGSPGTNVLDVSRTPPLPPMSRANC